MKKLTATIKSPSATSNHLKELNFIMQYFLAGLLVLLLRSGKTITHLIFISYNDKHKLDGTSEWLQVMC